MKKVAGEGKRRGGPPISIAGKERRVGEIERGPLWPCRKASIRGPAGVLFDHDNKGGRESR